MQGGIGENKIKALLAAPVCGVCFYPSPVWMGGGCFRQHFSGIVHAGNRGLRPAFMEHLGAVAWSATDVNDVRWIVQLNA
jgi:hypothetical protein